MASQFDPFHFFEVSDFVYENRLCGKEESCYRTAIGRIYYSIFLKIKDKMEKQGDFIRYKYSDGKNFGEHEILLKFLLTKGGEFTKLSNNLEKLRNLRVDSDYKIDKEVFESQVKLAKALFEVIKKNCQSCGYF